jgi:sulfonate transport system ATP-binding protein
MQVNALNHDRPVNANAQHAAQRGVPLIVQTVSKSYRGRRVLESIDLSIEAGEFVAVVGRSGCGKSTLLRLIAGLEAADSGRINFGKHGTAEKAQPETRVMFQDSRLLPWKSVLKNVSIGLQNGRDAAIDIAQQVLRQVGLADRASEWPAVLSGGQRQRVALARALVHDPELLLLDEPLGALDALTRIDMQQLIETLWQERGFTALLVTHDVQEAIALADRVVLIEDGRVTLDERIGLARPRSRGNPVFAQLEERILARVLKQPASQPDSALGDVSWSRTVNQVAWAV